MSSLGSATDARALRGCRSECPAGGDSTRGTDPESRVLRAAPGAGGARLRRAGAGAGEERA